MDKKLVEEIKENMDTKSAEELLTILKDDDRGKYSEETFEAVEQILLRRGLPLPRRAAPPVGDETKQVDARYKGVGGWLLFFCLSLVVLSPLIAVIGVILNYELLNSYGDRLMTWLTIDSIIDVALAVFSIYGGIMLWKVKPNAVRTAMIFLGFLICCNLFKLILLDVFNSVLPSMLQGSGEALRRLFSSFIFSAVWFLYLVFSKRVKATFGVVAL